MHRFLAAVLLLAASHAAFGAYDRVPAHGVTLAGRWLINASLSDDAEKLLAARLEKEYAEERRWRERYAGQRPDDPNVPLQLPPESEERRRRQVERLREMLGFTQRLEITQAEGGANVGIASDSGSRRFVAGTESQVSMPEGQLADSHVGWEGDWFVIQRSVKRGPRVVEKYRWLAKTDQLESLIAWSGGDTVLSGMKIRRIFDRDVNERPPPDPASGPVR